MDKVIHALNVLNMTEAFDTNNFYVVTVTPSELSLQGVYSSELVRQLGIKFDTSDSGYLEGRLTVDGVTVKITLTS